MISRALKFSFILQTLLWICIIELHAQNNSTLFKLLPASQTGIGFKNQLFENDSLNILNQANIYNGGGVGIGQKSGQNRN